MTETLLLFAGGVVAGFLNVVAGGGSLITMPLLIFFGLPEASANGTARLAILVQTGSGLLRYQRDNAVPWRAAGTAIPVVVVGAIAGAWTGTGLSAVEFRTLLVAATVAAGALVAFDLRVWLARRNRGLPVSRWLLFPGLLVAGFYGGMIQAGVGYLFLAALTLLGGFDLARANVLKILLICCYMPLALLIFALDGHVDWAFGGILAAGSAVGGWIGAAEVLKRGTRLIRIILFGVLLASGAYLAGLLG